MDLFQANSEVLQEVAQMFTEQADALREALQQFTTTADDIRDHAWIGLGANTFFDEFDTVLVPQAKQVITNLEKSAEGINKVAQAIEDGIAHILAVAKAPV
jgi:WXG100 family type VII secretion target